MRRSHARIRVHSKSSGSNKITTPKMDPIKIQIRRPTKHAVNTKYNLFSLSLVLILASLLFFSFYHIDKSKTHVKQYSVIIDGGSTGTRIHVLSYQISQNGPVFNFGEEGSTMKLNPGLSAHAKDPEAAGRSVAELVEFARRKVPKEAWGETEIRLMATAGMRLLDGKVQDEILEACRRVLRRSGFKFQEDWANVITGSDEGVYAWIVANYALGALGGDPLETTGIIELGGASAQVTFVSSEAVPPEFLRTVNFRNVTYNIYSHSFLHFGQNAALEALRESLVSGDHKLAPESLEKEIFIDPCTPKGYSHVTEPGDLSPSSMTNKDGFLFSHDLRGNFSECRSAALMLLQKGKEKCSYQHCNIGSTFIPKLQGKFLATENFFYTSEFFGLGPRAFLSDLMMAGQHFCGEDWSRLKQKHQSHDEEDLMRYCFSSAYIVALLHDSLGIAFDDERIAFANQVGNIPLDWALGAFILQSTSALDWQHPDWIANIVSEDPQTLLLLIVVSIFFMFVAWSLSKWRNPQLRTVYDLEKGKYIVSRIGRN